MNAIYKISMILLTSSIFFNNILAQDTHYWNLQYGTTSTLLGGAVIGSVDDLSSTYYNPGALSLAKDPSFILSAKIYEYNRFLVENGGSKGEDLSSSKVEPSPSFVAYSFKFNWLGENLLALSILTRQSMTNDVRTRNIASKDISEKYDGNEDFAGGYKFEQNLKDIWVGITWAKALHEKLGFGITTYFAYRGQYINDFAIAQAYSQDGYAASSIYLTNYDYKNIRLLWKFGLRWNYSPFSFGFTLTTPSINLMGNGITTYNQSTVVPDIDNNYMASNHLEDVKSKFNSPLSIGFGCQYQFDQSNLHFSLEWFNKVEKFTLLDTKSFSAQSSGEMINYSLMGEFASVLNLGLGYDFRMGEKFRGYVSIISDQSATIPNTETNLTISTWDIYHFTLGTSFDVGKSDVTVGLSYALGRDKLEHIVNVESGLIDLDKDATLRFSRIKLIFGFEI